MDSVDLKQEIIDYLFEHGEVCKDKCGKTLVEISIDLDITYKATKELLKELYNEKRVVIKTAPFQTLIFLNYGKI